MTSAVTINYQTGESSQGKNSSQNYIIHTLTQCISSHVLSGLCKISGYEILRHGTSWKNYQSILREGVNLSLGGKITQKVTDYFSPSDRVCPLVEKAKNKFYVVRDREFGISKQGFQVLFCLTPPLAKRVMSVTHSALAYFAQDTKEPSKWVMAFAVIKALVTPKLKFIYSSEEIENIFENDPDYNGEAAYRTSTALPNHRIGLIGFCTHVNRTRIWEQLKSNPLTFVFGVIQLLIGVLLTSVPGLGIIT